MTFSWPEVLAAVSTGADLNAAQAEAAMGEVLAGNATDAQLAGLIVGLRAKGETPTEMVGMVKAMLAAAEPLSIPTNSVDIVGTGGSAHGRKHALNVSTMACFVAAGAGATICKHGNYKASSTSGAFDFLETLGINIGITPAQLEDGLAKTGMGFVFARTFHPAMRFAGGVRAELGIPTVFNVLGPLANPGRPKAMVVGTANTELASRMAQVLQELGVESAWVVTGTDGLDELSTAGANTVHVVTPDDISVVEIHPSDVGIEIVSSTDEFAGGTAAQNVEIFSQMMTGKPSAARNIVVLNAAAALVVSGVAKDLLSGVAMCSEALDSGAVSAKVEALKAAF